MANIQPHKTKTLKLTYFNNIIDKPYENYKSLLIFTVFPKLPTHVKNIKNDDPFFSFDILIKNPPTEQVIKV
jgi:hypothetical protein